MKNPDILLPNRLGFLVMLAFNLTAYGLVYLAVVHWGLS